MGRRGHCGGNSIREFADRGPSGIDVLDRRTEQRLFASVMNRLYALDPATGKPIASFGDHGSIDLRKDLRGDYTQHYVSLTSPNHLQGSAHRRVSHRRIQTRSPGRYPRV